MENFFLYGLSDFSSESRVRKMGRQISFLCVFSPLQMLSVGRAKNSWLRRSQMGLVSFKMMASAK